MGRVLRGDETAPLISGADAQAISAVMKRSMLDLGADFVAPRTPVEHRVAKIWCEVFGLDEVGLTDNFFDLGGDSLAATAIAAVISSDFDTKFRPSLLMTHQTVAEVAALVERETSTNEAGGAGVVLPTHLVPVRTEGSLPPVFVIHGKSGISFPSVGFLDGLDKEQPVYFVQAIGLMNEAVPPRTIEAIAANYLETLRLVQPRGALNIASFCAGGLIAIEMANQLQAAGDPPASVTLVDPSLPYSKKGGRFRFWLRPVIRPVLRRWREVSTPVSALLARAGLARKGTTSGQDFQTRLERWTRKIPHPIRFDPDVVWAAQNALYHAYYCYRPKVYSQRVRFILSRERHDRLVGETRSWRDLLDDLQVHITTDRHADLFNRDAALAAGQLQRGLLGDVPE